MNPSQQGDVATWQRFVPEKYLVLKKLRTTVLDMPKLVIAAFKAVMLEEEIDQTVYSIELYEYNQAVHQHCRNYYQRLVSLSCDEKKRIQRRLKDDRQQAQKKKVFVAPTSDEIYDMRTLPEAFLRVYEFGMHQLNKDGKIYTYIVREYLHHHKTLAAAPTMFDEVREKCSDILRLFQEMHHKDIFYGELSPSRLLRAESYPVSASSRNRREIFKVADSYIQYVHAPPVSGSGLRLEHYYLSEKLLTEKLRDGKVHLDYRDDYESLMRSMYWMLTEVQLFQECLMHDELAKELRKFTQAQPLERQKLLYTEKVQQRYPKAQFQFQEVFRVLAQGVTESPQSLYSKLYHTVTNLRPGKEVKKSEASTCANIEGELEKKEMQQAPAQNMSQFLGRIVANHREKFMTLEEELQIEKAKITEMDAMKYMERVAYTVYGNRVLSMINFTLGQATGSVQMIRPDRKTETIVFEPKERNAVRVECYIRCKSSRRPTSEADLEKDYRKVYLFFRYDGSNPLNMTPSELGKNINNTLSMDLKFKPHCDSEDQRKPEDAERSYQRHEILQYNQESIREMEERMKGIEFSRDALKKLKHNQQKFKTAFIQKEYVDLFKRESRVDNERVDFTYESVALFGVMLDKMRILNLARNALTDDFLEVLQSKKSTFFGRLKTLKLSFNSLTDRSLEIMVQCCKQKRWRNFQELTNLIMDHNSIKECTGFQQDPLPKLEVFDLDFNQIVAGIDAKTFWKFRSLKQVYISTGGVIAEGQGKPVEQAEEPPCTITTWKNIVGQDYYVFMDRRQ